MTYGSLYFDLPQRIHFKDGPAKINQAQAALPDNDNACSRILSSVTWTPSQSYITA